MRKSNRAVIQKETQFRQMQIKTTVRKRLTRFYFIPIRLSKMNKSANDNGNGTQRIENTLHDRSVTGYNHFREQFVFVVKPKRHVL